MNANVTRYDKWALRTMNDPRTKRYHATRAVRRRLVGTHIALTGVGLAGLVVGYGSGSPWLLAVPLVTLIGWVPVTGLLNSMTRGLLELRTRLLDERQLAERGAVHTLAHRILGWTLVAALFGFLVASMAGVPLDALAAPLAVAGLGLLALHFLLPLWCAALRAQDEPEDEVGDEPGGVARA